jgi:hypothetical protein
MGQRLTRDKYFNTNAWNRLCAGLHFLDEHGGITGLILPSFESSF